MNGLTFDETVERYARLSGLPIETAREQMREQLAQQFKSLVIGKMNEAAATLGLTFVEGCASGINPEGKIGPIWKCHWANQRQHVRQANKRFSWIQLYEKVKG